MFPFNGYDKKEVTRVKTMKMEKPLIEPSLAGAVEQEGATINMPEGKSECTHSFQTEMKTLTKLGWFGAKEELLATIVFCKKCGRLGSSSRITF